MRVATAVALCTLQQLLAESRYQGAWHAAPSLPQNAHAQHRSCDLFIIIDHTTSAACTLCWLSAAARMVQLPLADIAM